MTITWYMVPEVSNSTDRVLCHFGLSFALSPSYEPRKLNLWKNKNNAWRYYHFTHVHHKWQSHDVWFLRYRSHDVCFLRYWEQQAEFFVILDCFLPFHPPIKPQNQNFEKMKKAPENIIISRMCTINDNLMHSSWDVECDRQIFCDFKPFFAISPPNNP